VVYGDQATSSLEPESIFHSVEVWVVFW
jgi:hypothetical protein